jgi:hypothetical protein
MEKKSITDKADIVDVDVQGIIAWYSHSNFEFFRKVTLTIEWLYRISRDDTSAYVT